MTVLRDTSILVAALVKNHPSHSQAAGWLNQVRAQELECVISSHSVAELYATLSTLRIRPPLTPARAAELIERDVRPCGTIGGLTPRQYVPRVRRLSATGLHGAIIYDAIHAEVARRAKVDLLVTLNRRDFERVGAGRPEQLVSPLDTSPP